MARTVSTLTLNVALAICGSNGLTVKRFAEQAGANEYMAFTHFIFFYSFPEFGKKWKSGKDCEFHRVYTQCHICKEKPERNLAGVGFIYLLNNSISNNKNRMICLCEKHVSSYFKWNPQMKTRGKQLNLF